MSTQTGRNYGRAIRPMNVEERRVVTGGRKNEFMTFAQVGGKKVRTHVVFSTAVDKDYSLWGMIRTNDAEGSRRFDATGFRWNQIYDRVAGSLAAGRKGNYDAHFRKLAEIRELAQGWDSYGAEPPSALACDLAKKVLVALAQHSLPVSFITATSDGSILLKHQVGAASVTWEIDNDGEIGVMVERAGVPPQYFSPDANGIAALVADLARHG